jgi:hypothetical protein
MASLEPCSALEAIMRKLVAASDSSPFNSIAELARSVIDAPTGPEGIPRVHARLELIDGQPVLVAKTCDASQTTLLMLHETDPQRMAAALAYLTERLAAIGLDVVDDEAQLEPVH